MKTIAFKRAGKHPHLHPEFVTEWIDTVFLTSLEGYESLNEVDFQVELAKNEQRQKEFEAYLKKEAEMNDKALVDASLATKLKAKNEEREYERFKAWQRHQGKK